MPARPPTRVVVVRIARSDGSVIGEFDALGMTFALEGEVGRESFNGELRMSSDSCTASGAFDGTASPHGIRVSGTLASSECGWVQLLQMDLTERQ